MNAKVVASLDGHGNFPCKVKHSIQIVYGRFTLAIVRRMNRAAFKYCRSGSIREVFYFRVIS